MIPRNPVGTTKAGAPLEQCTDVIKNVHQQERCAQLLKSLYYVWKEINEMMAIRNNVCIRRMLGACCTRENSDADDMSGECLFSESNGGMSTEITSPHRDNYGCASPREGMS